MDIRRLLVATVALCPRRRGFVWRLQTEEGDATALRVFDADMIMINMSVWDRRPAGRRGEYRRGG